MVGWGESLLLDIGLGIVISFGQECDMFIWVVCVVWVKVDCVSGKVMVEKLFLVVDVGIIVYLDGVLVQVQGVVLWGLSMVLYEGNVFDSGQICDINFDCYILLCIMDVLVLVVEFMFSIEVVVGLGELVIMVVGLVIGNVIFVVCGVRLWYILICFEDVFNMFKQQV